ncbi:MAG: hypothetical protein M0C28_39425 [Candidatus Moduliflexus flocculans]|nr:hypothetical protein [Candidatus Moduliflexus flocculans]
MKAVTRAGMGACGGKTCTTLIQRLFREEGVPDGRYRRPAEASPVRGGAAGRLRRRWPAKDEMTMTAELGA